MLFLIPALVDTCLLCYYVLDMGLVGTFMRANSQGVEPLWYKIIFPKLLYPWKAIFLTMSIFVVVTIAAERHRAICTPLTHRPTFWPYAVMAVAGSGRNSMIHKDDAGRF